MQDPITHTSGGELSFEVWYGEPEEPEPPRPSRRRGVALWLLWALVVLALGGAFILGGQRLYDPASRVPEAPAYPLQRGFLDATEPVATDLEAVLAVAGEAVELELTGDVHAYALPRTVADRLFGKRDERALIFGATIGGGPEMRFIVLEGADSRFFAVESQLRRAPGVGGLFLGIPVTEDRGDSPFRSLLEALEALLPDVREARAETLSSDHYTLFGPFAGGDREELSRRVEANFVLRHLAESLEEAGADVSLAAPALFLYPTPPRGVIEAVYLSQHRLVQEPLGGAATTNSLAHELVHAYVHRVMPDPQSALREAVAYYDAVHPRLYRDMVGDLYEQLDSLGRAEEAIAFVVGAVAAGQTRTIASARLLQNEGLLSVSEPVLARDIDFLVGLGLLPACMHPEALGHTQPEITFSYYEEARAACG